MTATFRSALEHVIGAEGVLSIRLGSGEVRLRAVDGTAVRVRDRRDHDIAGMFHIEQSEGSLSLSVDHGRAWFSARHHTPELDVDVPRRAAVVIESASGDISADGLQGDQRYRTASGNLAMRGCAGRLVVDAVSGDIDLVAVADIDLSARTVSGDLEIRAGNLRKLGASTTSGDLKIAGRFSGHGPYTIETVSGDGVLAPVGDIQIEMTTIAGDLRSDLEARPEGGRGRRKLIVGSTGPLLTFSSLSGDLHVTRSVVLDRRDAAASNAVLDAASEAAPTTDRLPASLAPIVPAPAPTTDEAIAADEPRPTSEPATPAPDPGPERGTTVPTLDLAPDPAPTERAVTTDWPAWSDTAHTSGAGDADPTLAEAPETRTSPTGSADIQPDPRMDVLRALERGDIDVAEAGARLEALDTDSSNGGGSSDA